MTNPNYDIVPQKLVIGKMEDRPVILFDGDCNLCSWSAEIIRERDPEGFFKIIPLKTGTRDQLNTEPGSEFNKLDSIVLLDGSAYLTKSDAVLRIAQQLPGWWAYLSILTILPRSLRDFIYDLIANRRYRWFGKKVHPH